MFSLQEYQALANKIHELQEKESQLITTLENTLENKQNNHNGRDSPEETEKSEDENPTNMSVPLLLGPAGSGIPTSQPSPKAVRAGHIKCYLPDEQVTSVCFMASLL